MRDAPTSTGNRPRRAREAARGAASSSRLLAARLKVHHATVARAWKAYGVQPWRSETFKFSTDPELAAKVTDVVGLYLAPPENAVVLCVDEKSQIQALDRTAPMLPMQPGLPERRTHDYRRHGTTTLPARLRETTSACEDAQMSPRARAVDPGRLARWCVEHLGSPPADEIFSSGYLSAVIGLRLADGREVVVKVRPDSPRIAACVEVQRRMFQVGYPCPRPLTGAAAFGGDVATAEAYVPGGAMLPSADHAALAFAAAFARLIRLAPRPAEVSMLDPAPSWAAWNHGGDGLWPCPEKSDVNLNEVAGAEWIDDAGRRARDRLRASESEAVIGHCDWLAGNLRWSGDALLVVHDWDSVIADSEAVLAGFAAALYSTVSAEELATVEDTERFLVAYCHARGREFSADELQRSWAAGVWTRAYDAKYQHTAGEPITSLSENEALERLRRTRTGSRRS